MENTNQSNAIVSRFFKTIGLIMADVWNTAQTCGFCCGIRFDREKRGDDMPTPSSCCGVRV